MELFSLLCLRFEVDLSRLQVNERQLYNHVLDPGKGRLVFLVTLRPCWGVSISDIETATLEKPVERDAVKEKFVRPFLLFLRVQSKVRISDDFMKIHLHQHQLYSVMHQMLRMHFHVSPC